MQVVDSGHKYLLKSFDGGEPILLTFVKRNNPPEKYPGNRDAYPGTQIQEVLRALIDRVVYVQRQGDAIGYNEVEDPLILSNFRESLWLLETRVRRIRKQPSLGITAARIEHETACSECGHIRCLNHLAKEAVDARHDADA